MMFQKCLREIVDCWWTKSGEVEHAHPFSHIYLAQGLQQAIISHAERRPDTDGVKEQTLSANRADGLTGACLNTRTRLA